jgi:S-adenosylmethionine synthetase
MTPTPTTDQLARPTSIVIDRQPSPAEGTIEVVERKGLGHPDTIADALAERMSVAYSRHCQQLFGAVLHHNLDKVYLRGGHCQTSLGAFEMTEPVTLVIGGRVSTSFGGQRIGHQILFEQTARDYLTTVLPGFDHTRWLRIEHATTDRSRFPTWFHPRALADLPELTSPTASDTVAVTGWWPHTPTEQLTLALERHLNQEGQGPRDQRLGQDIKIMAIRHGQHVDVTANVAVHPLAAPDTATYDEIIAEVHAELAKVADTTLGGALNYQLRVNSGDANPYRGKRHYLLGSGSCLELGEEGFVGRGNTTAGLIPVHRPKSAEAAFGKNPTYHAGKVYSLHAEMASRAIYAATGTPATVTIVARHSDPLIAPALVHVGLHGDASRGLVSETARTTLASTDHLALALGGHLIPR